MKENKLLIFTLTAVVTGVGCGLFLRQFELTDDVKSLVSFPGEIFMQILKLMVLPLIFASLISSLGQMDASKSVTTPLIHPGNPEMKNQQDVEIRNGNNLSALNLILDLVRNMFPENIIEATMYKSQTELVVIEKATSENETMNPSVILKKTIKQTKGTNILGLIVFCTGFGIIISKLEGRAKIIVNFFVVLDQIVMRLISFFMCFSLFGIISLIASSILDIDDIHMMMTTMALYVLTILTSLLLHCLVAIPILYFIITRRNPINIPIGMIQPLVTAIGTASSGASLPQAISSVEENLHVDPRIAGFIMPLGNTINMDGNALYEAVAVIFIAQLNNISLSFSQIITICVTATFSSIGLNAVPAGLVSIFVILSTVNLPVSDISLLFTVDWFIDRVRTACVVQHFMKNDLIEQHTESSDDLNLKEGSPKTNQTNIKDEVREGNTVLCI